MDWKYGSRGRVPAFQVRSPDFKPPFHQKKKKERKGRVKGEKGAGGEEENEIY
jgi:hypothetical protein